MRSKSCGMVPLVNEWSAAGMSSSSSASVYCMTLCSLHRGPGCMHFCDTVHIYYGPVNKHQILCPICRMSLKCENANKNTMPVSLLHCLRLAEAFQGSTLLIANTCALLNFLIAPHVLILGRASLCSQTDTHIFEAWMPHDVGNIPLIFCCMLT